MNYIYYILLQTLENLLIKTSCWNEVSKQTEVKRTAADAVFASYVASSPSELRGGTRSLINLRENRN